MSFQKMKPYLWTLFFTVIAYLVFHSFQKIDFAQIKEGLIQIDKSILLIGFGMVIFVYFILASYDYLSFRILNSKILSYPQVLLSAFICYTFTLNVGALIGGVGLRYRIYQNWKIPTKKVSSVVLLSTLTNWSGYFFLLALVFLKERENVLKLIGLSPTFSILSGAALLTLLGFYYISCWKKKEIKFRKYQLQLPSLQIALFQLFISCLQWSILSYTLFYILHKLGPEIIYQDVLFVLLIASVAGVVTHVPAGLGVMEAIFLKMNLTISDNNLLVGMVGFRIVYYLIPLAIALPGYLLLEIYQKRRGHKSVPFSS